MIRLNTQWNYHTSIRFLEGRLIFEQMPFWLVFDHTTKGRPQTEAVLLILFQTGKFKGGALWGYPLQGVRQIDLPLV